MRMTIELTKAQVTEAAIKALNEGRIGVQNLVDAQESFCRYRYDSGSCCAIGAALTDEQAEYLDSFNDCTSVGMMLIRGIIIVPNEDEAQWLKDLQDAHDECCSAIRAHNYDVAVEEWERLIKLLGLDPSQYSFPHPTTGGQQ